MTHIYLWTTVAPETVQISINLKQFCWKWKKIACIHLNNLSIFKTSILQNIKFCLNSSTPIKGNGRKSMEIVLHRRLYQWWIIVDLRLVCIVYPSTVLSDAPCKMHLKCITIQNNPVRSIHLDSRQYHH